MTGVASTIWAQLAGLNAAAGSIVYLGPDSATPVLDAANLNYDQVLKHQYIGFAYNPAYTRYGSTDVAGLTIEKMIDSYVAAPLQATYGGNAEHAVTSSQGSAQVPQFSTAGDLLGIFSGRGYYSSNPGSVAPGFGRFADIEIYADGGNVPVVGNVGGQIQIKTKANGGILTTAITIKQDQSVLIAGALTVIGAIIFAGGVSATQFVTTTQGATIPQTGIYSDIANTLDIAGNSIKLASFGPAAITFTQPLTTPGITSTGAVALSPVNANVVISPSGTGIVTVNPATAGTLNNVSLGATTPLAVTSTALTATGTVTLSPANLNVAISPTGTGTVAISPVGALTINPTAASTMNNVAVGGTTPAAGSFVALTATGAVALSPANANVVLSPTGTGVVTINPATAGTINNVSIGVTTPLAGAFTTLAASAQLLFNQVSADRVATAGLTPKLQVAGGATNNNGIAIFEYSNDASQPYFSFAKSKGTGPGVRGAVANTSILGSLTWQGDDGTNIVNAADIVTTVNNTVATNQVPTYMSLRVTSAAGTLSEALRLVGAAGAYVQLTNSANPTFTTSSGNISIGSAGGTTILSDAIIKFGTYTAGVIAQAGSVSITDSGGTVRRLLVG